MSAQFCPTPLARKARHLKGILVAVALEISHNSLLSQIFAT
jgi:hypothetical protein